MLTPRLGARSPEATTRAEESAISRHVAPYWDREEPKREFDFESVPWRIVYSTSARCGSDGARESARLVRAVLGSEFEFDEPIELGLETNSYSDTHRPETVNSN